MPALLDKQSKRPPNQTLITIYPTFINFPTKVRTFTQFFTQQAIFNHETPIFNVLFRFSLPIYAGTSKQWRLAI